MQDTKKCLVCGNRLSTIRMKNKHLHWVGKTANYAERVCSKGVNHFLQLFVDESTKTVDMLTVSIQYSRHFRIDFINGKCRVVCLKENQPEYIEIPKMIEPDFPDLVRVKEKVAMYVVFS